SYKVREHPVLIGSYRGHAIATAPPPSAGGEVLLTLLNIMETLPADRAYRDPMALHTYIEASKHAFADRYLIADPKFMRDVTRELTTKERGVQLAQSIGERATSAFDVPPGQFAKLPPGVIPKIPLIVKPGEAADMPLTGAATAPTQTIDPKKMPHTTHLSTIDAEGNAVSLTTTVNYAFGSCVVAKGTGVLWNDEMDDFAVAPGVPNAYGVIGNEANTVAAGKVPVSSMTPSIVFEGPTVDSPIRLVVGSPGGPRISTTVAQIILNYFDLGTTVQQAIALGRVHHQHLPDTVMIERVGVEAATVAELERRGHTIKRQETWSNATVIAVDPKTGVRTGAADPRGVGSAMAE
ncbi:MAG: gamma-glutamyltransferase, partial [Clostridia bacterium]|nr:gamma-glutamyltransferase [Deltaproteobacteria bacterium]